MRKFFVVLVWVMGLGLAALFAKRYSTWSEECDCDKSFYPC